MLAPTLGDLLGESKLPDGTAGDRSGFFVHAGAGRVGALGDEECDDEVERFGFDGPVERSEAMMATVVDEVVAL